MLCRVYIIYCYIIYINVRNELAVGLISLIIFFTGEMGILCNALQKIK